MIKLTNNNFKENLRPIGKCQNCGKEIFTRKEFYDKDKYINLLLCYKCRIR